jgi:hypothetical protein
MFFPVDFLRQGLSRIFARHRNLPLNQDGAGVGSLIYNMNRTTRFAFSGGKYGPVNLFAVHARPAVFGKQRRMQIDDPPRIPADDVSPQYRKKTRKDDKAGAAGFRNPQDPV